MSKYTYSGPVSSVTLRVGEDELVDVHFHPGAEEIECPDNHPYIERLVRKGFLTPVGAEPAAAPEAPARRGRRAAITIDEPS